MNKFAAGPPSARLHAEDGGQSSQDATKVWRMTEYSQVALMDTDMVFDVDAESCNLSLSTRQTS